MFSFLHTAPKSTQNWKFRIFSFRVKRSVSQRICGIRSRFRAFLQISQQKSKKKTLKQISVFWRRRRDSNSRAGHPAYSLSRGAPSPLGYFSMVNQLYEIRRKTGAEKRNGGESGIRTHGSFESLVFKTSSLNHSDTSPHLHSLV